MSCSRSEEVPPHISYLEGIKRALSEEVPPHISYLEGIKRALSEEVPPHMISQMSYLEEMGVKFVPVRKVIPIPKRCEITEEERENNRMLHQAKLAHILKIQTANRLLGEDQSKTPLIRSLVGEFSQKCEEALLIQKSLYPPKHENHWVAQLPKVRLLSANGERIEGTLEAACGSGFTFTAPGIHVHFKDTSVALCFYFRFASNDPDINDLNIPGLQFHLRDPVRVGAVETKDIIFVLEDGVKEVLENCTFEGVISGSSKKLALTFRALVVLAGLPCTVVPLTDIEIVDLSVNLEQKQGSVGIDMTVVLKDFERKVLQINSIDLRKLNFIKGCLDNGGVKYYCRDYLNSPKVDWNSKLEEILKDPKKFVESGGWESLNLEDPKTLSYYKIAGEQPKFDWAGAYA